MVTFAGIDHVSFTVTDLDRSERFYTGLFGFVTMLDVGYGRICMHPQTGFTLALVTHEGDRGGSFTELTTGMDHLGLAAGSREELQEWEQRFEEAGVPYTPIIDTDFGFHLNFRDPDGIALELIAPNELFIGLTEQLRAGVTTEQIDEKVTELLGADVVVDRD